MLLLGPRQTGKSTLIRNSVLPTQTINLLDNETYLALKVNPAHLRHLLPPAGHIGTIAVDEIQRIPELLNEVHLEIEERGLKFLLTGSSARKLRSGGINLLGGRASCRYMHPFSFIELKEQFNLEDAITFGTLPFVFQSLQKKQELFDYISTYLQLEIANEGLSRSIPAFLRFLHTAALCNAQILNFTSIASDCAVARTTMNDYFQILVDTLLCKIVEPFGSTAKRKVISAPKLYFFDTGVANAIVKRFSVAKGTREFGECFESYFFHELNCFVDYASPQSEITYWRTKTGAEVDFILDDKIAIECKAKTKIAKDDLKGLEAFWEENKLVKLKLAYLGDVKMNFGNIEVLPWQDLIKELYLTYVL